MDYVIDNPLTLLDVIYIVTEWYISPVGRTMHESLIYWCHLDCIVSLKQSQVHNFGNVYLFIRWWQLLVTSIRRSRLVSKSAYLDSCCALAKQSWLVFFFFLVPQSVKARVSPAVVHIYRGFTRFSRCLELCLFGCCFERTPGRRPGVSPRLGDVP